MPRDLRIRQDRLTKYRTITVIFARDLRYDGGIGNRMAVLAARVVPLLSRDEENIDAHIALV